MVEVLSCSRGGNVNGECTNVKEQNWWCKNWVMCVGRGGRRRVEGGRCVYSAQLWACRFVK